MFNFRSFYLEQNSLNLIIDIQNFIDMWSIDEIVLGDITEKKFSDNFIDTIKFFFRMFVPLTIGEGIKKLSTQINYLKLVIKYC